MPSNLAQSPLTIEDWVAERKASVLLEPVGLGDVSSRMLEITPTNKRETERQAHLNVSFVALGSCLRSEKNRQRINEFVYECRVATLTVDGKANSRNMALEALGKQAVVEQQKQGFFGKLFGGNKGD